MDLYHHNIAWFIYQVCTWPRILSYFNQLNMDFCFN